MRTKLIVSALAGVMAWAGPAFGQEWPTRPITMVVAYLAGGPVDTVARVVASRLSEVLSQ
jgi:tripartite-type tricarboxylate transporter receptor subunit TctC